MYMVISRVQPINTYYLVIYPKVASASFQKHLQWPNDKDRWKDKGSTRSVGVASGKEQHVVHHPKVNQWKKIISESSSSPGQAWVLQFCDSDPVPEHGVPPQASLMRMERERCWVPPPHVLEHAVQDDQAFH